jgi:hypothetical protein
MPFVIDWLIVAPGTVGVATLAINTWNIDYRGRWEKPVHFLIIAHMGVSVMLLAWTIYVHYHDLYAVFQPEYSYFALAYFPVFCVAIVDGYTRQRCKCEWQPRKSLELHGNE